MKTSGAWRSKLTVVSLGTMGLITAGLLWRAERFPVVNGIHDLMSPLARLARGSVSVVSYPFHLMNQLVVMGRGGEELRAEMVRLRHENLELHETLKAFQRIEKLSAFRSPVGYRTAPAAIVAYEPTNYVSGCIIDRGTEDGAFPAMVAMTDEGVVGRLLSVSDHTARLIFLSDPNCRVAVVTERSRVMGVVAGTGGNRGEMLYVSADEDVQEGDRLLTSGQGGVFPKGLPVGRVARVERSPNGISLAIQVEPFVKFSRLEEILLVFPLSAR